VKQIAVASAEAVVDRSAGAATVLDVARAAGVSTATAARALGGYGSVSPATLQRVQDAAAAIGYRANGLARSMITGLTHSIGVVLADIENPFFYGVLRGISDTARARGYDVLLANTDEDPDDERKAVSALFERRVEGLVLCPVEGDEPAQLRSMVRSNVPIVLLDRPAPGLSVDSVGLDNRRAAYDVTTHLLGLGHRRISLVTGGTSAAEAALRRPGMRDVERIPFTTLGARAAGYRDALLDAGIEPRADYLTAGGFRRDDATESVRRLMSLPEPPTAVVAFDSILALGTLLGLRAAGLRCPDDVSVVGFDDADWAEVVSPSLSVLRQPVHEIGVKACDLLVGRIADPQRRRRHHRLPGTLVLRGSTGPPPVAAATMA
jgi:DNA-binding LacI/PurR family transcriptional regulator